MLELFLDSISYILIIVGLILFVASLVAEAIPFIAKYRMIAQVVSMIMLCSGFWFAGLNQCTEANKIEKLEVEHKANIITEKSNMANEEISQKTEKAIEYIHIKGDTIIEKVPVYITKEVDKNCAIPKELIDLHNEMIK